MRILPAPGHRIYPDPLRDVVIDRPNQVWAADITYIPIGRGSCYLVAIIDWFSRAALAEAMRDASRWRIDPAAGVPEAA